MKTNKLKKGLHSNLVRFFRPNRVQASNKRTEHTLCVIKPYEQLPKGGMRQFCLLFYAILQTWLPKGGGAWHNAPPPKYAHAWIVEFVLFQNKWLC